MRKFTSLIVVFTFCIFILSVSASAQGEFVTKLKFIDDEINYTSTVEKCLDSMYHFIYTKKSLNENKTYTFQFKSKQNRIKASELKDLLNSSRLILDGFSKSYEFNQLKKEGRVVDNIFVDEWIYYSGLGKKCKSINYGPLTSNRLVTTYYDYNGRIVFLTTTDKSGERNGAEITFYDNGKVHTVANYLGDTLSGDYNIYDMLSTHYDSYRVVDILTEDITSEKVIEQEFDLIQMQYELKDLFAACKIGIQHKLESDDYNDDLLVSIDETGVIRSVSLGSLAEVNTSEIGKKGFVTELAGLPIPIRFKIPLSVLYLPDSVCNDALINKELEWVLNDEIIWVREITINPYVHSLDTRVDSVITIEPTVMPSFVGGEDSLVQFLKDNVVYPEESLQNKEEGRVFVRFIVTKRGDIANISILRGSYPLLNQESMRIVSIMPKWNPGSLDGEFVAVKYVLPVNFELSKMKENSKNENYDL